jgi:hypothetical protein
MATLSEAGETFRGLSRAAESFLAFTQRYPGLAWELDSTAVTIPDWLPPEHSSTLQPWPTFVGGEKLHEVQRATLEVTRLVKSVPEKVFGGNAKEISRFFGIGDEALMALLLVPPNGIDEGFARCDLIDSAEGFKCLEVNASARIGGWDVRLWADLYRRTPRIAEFLAEQGLEISYVDTLEVMFSHIVRHSTQRGLGREGSLNIAVVVNAEVAQVNTRGEGHFNEAFTKVLDKHGLEGRVWIGSYHDLRVVGGLPYHRSGARIHAVVEYTDVVTPTEIFRCFKAGTVSLYGGPVSQIIADKRNLALLSELQDSSLFDAEDRSLIRAHVPWSRLVLPGTGHGREAAPTYDELLAGRERLVLKRGMSFKGQDVIIGPRTSPQDWEKALQRAVAEGCWMVQEHVTSRPYLYYHRERGPSPHEVVWGTFCFGSTYGGEFLRMMAEGLGEGIVSFAHGATKGFVFMAE